MLIAVPSGAHLPGAVQNLLNLILVEVTPVEYRAGKIVFGVGILHGAVVAAGESALFLCSVAGLGGILMLSDNIAAAVKQRKSSGSFHNGIIPSVGPLYINGSIGINGFNTQSEGVDAAIALGKLLCSNIADLVGNGSLTGSDTRKITSLISAAEIVAEVCIVALVAGAVHELHIGILLGSLSGGLHKAEAVGEDKRAAVIIDKAFNGSRGSSGIAVIHIVTVIDLYLAVKAGLCIFHSASMSIGIALVILASDADKTYLENISALFRLAAGEGEHGNQQQCNQSKNSKLLHVVILPPENLCFY